MSIRQLLAVAAIIAAVLSLFVSGPLLLVAVILVAVAVLV